MQAHRTWDYPVSRNVNQTGHSSELRQAGQVWSDRRIMKTMTPRELAEHLRALKASKEQDLDELLTDLLVHSYPTKVVQNS